MSRNWSEEFEKKHKEQLQNLDIFLANWDPDQSELAAHIMLKVLRVDPPHPFAREFLLRAEQWKEKYLIDIGRGRPSHGLGEELVQLLFHREQHMAMDLLEREKQRKAGKLVPSILYRTPKEPITDDEVVNFMDLIDEHGISEIFDPANLITCGIVARIPFVVVGKARYSFEEMSEKYTARDLARPWDKTKRDPVDGMLFDWVLHAARREGKWTWVTCDRWFRRLPWSHPLKSAGGQRPGWKWSTEIMAGTGLMVQRRGKTWGLTRDGRKVVDEFILPLWEA